MAAFVSPFVNGRVQWCSSPFTFSSSLSKPKSIITSVRKRSTIVAIAPTSSPPQKLVDDLLRGIENTDSGVNISTAKRTEIDAIIEQLGEIGKSQKPMQDPTIFSRYAVAYTSTKNKSPPAGGLFRGKIGRILFRTRGLFQHLIQPDTAINIVSFKLFGLLNGSACLKGRIEPIPDSDIGPNAIAVWFQRPRLRLGRAVFEFGPKSRVRIRTTYLDDRVRVAVGSRGSLFVFSKGGQADSELAEEWKYVFSSKPLPTILLPLAGLSALLLTYWAPIGLRIIAVIVAMMLTFVLKRGGTDITPDILPENYEN